MHIHPFKLERYFAKYEFNVPYILCSSDGESFTLEELFEYEPQAWEAFKKVWLGHTQSQGHPELREQIAGLYTTVSADEILVHTGAEEAIFNCMNVLLEPKDHIIVHYPRYQSLSEVGAAIGCEITFWKTHEKNHWELDLDFLRENIRKNTKMIIINCPHNPTGYLMSVDKFSEIINICREHNIYLFSDEVYRYLEYDNKARLPAACDLYEKAISLGVMSKTFSLAGLRIGWIATKDSALLDNLAKFKDYTSRCNSAPSEFLSTLALKHVDKIIERNLQIVKSNLVILSDFFSLYREIFTWSPPKAGSVTFPGLKNHSNADEFCKKLVDESGVLLLPGTCFSDYKRHFRVGFGHKDMLECIEHLEKYIETHF